MKVAVISNLFHTFALAFKKQGWLPEWPNGADCKSAGYAFGGSNPSPPTFPKTTQKIKNPIPFIRFRILRFYIPTCTLSFIFGWTRKNFSLPKQKLFPAQGTLQACVCVLGQFTKKSLLLARVKAV